MTVLREATVDLAAIAENLRVLRSSTQATNVLAVVKADAYGHGAVPVARTLVAAGADMLGTADIDEARALRGAGIDAPILCWLHGPDADFEAALAQNIEVAVSSIEQLNAVADAARRLRASDVPVQIKLDTGLSRNGAAPELAGALFARAAKFEAERVLRVRGLMTHVSNTAPAEDLAQVAQFENLVADARAAGLRPDVLHAAATAAALRIPESRFNLVRLGIGLYGLTPFDDETSQQLGIRPAMTLRAPVAAVRRVPAGAGISYGFTHRTSTPTTLALIPLGYGDGIPRQASNGGTVAIRGRIVANVGRVAMDQFVVDVGDAPVEVGDEAVLFGDAAQGVPSADDWANAASTINYEIVTRLGSRVVRRYEGA
ncbi:alanine racemase [Microbacterium sp. MPKO10]|uniref:alanine racemase n=1 Tax=Microbacterium sp. MPKO10 TaxID=2989818 RepID=UPI002235BAD2|nr:alanine racemase [Microbacterium sp. MPKO10]MCW4457597.1 alanine racemase [Microbacterium sp. MPKO10]